MESKFIKMFEDRLSAIERRMNRTFHGNSGYTHGCRCDICREGRKIGMREYRIKRKEFLKKKQNEST